MLKHNKTITKTIVLFDNLLKIESIIYLLLGIVLELNNLLRFDFEMIVQLKGPAMELCYFSCWGSGGRGCAFPVEGIGMYMCNTFYSFCL